MANVQTKSTEANQEDVNNCVLVAHANLDKVKELVTASPALATGRAEWDETPIEAA